MSDTVLNNITRRCVSLANGDLSPDLRVNYEFGLVLGVDEFRQEQLYFLEKKYLHNRALHGYGTVSGLNVTLQKKDNDIQISVATGIGIDQFGRTFVVRHEQCAMLGAWLKKQQNPPVAADKGIYTVYLVASYDECLDSLVRIAGQPCSTEDQMTAPSRIRDSFDLTLRNQPPTMLAWDAVRRFALLMDRVIIDAALHPDQSDEQTITEIVRLLDQAGTGGNLSLAGDYRLPADGANAALDRIFTVWVTEVRPRLKPNLIDPQADQETESAVLLATIIFRLADGSNPANPVFVDITANPNDAVSDEGRPFLLHTQLIQELLLLGSGAQGKPTREFATLHVVDARRILLWIHHREVIRIDSDSYELWVDKRHYQPSTTRLSSADDPTNLYELELDNDDEMEQLLAVNARVEVRFRLNAVGVVHDPDAAVPEPSPLIDEIDSYEHGYIGRDGDTLTVYTFADTLPDVREFVSFDTLVQGQEKPRIRLWFHVDSQLVLDKNNVAVLVDGIKKDFRFSPEGGRDSMVWLADLQDEERLEDGARLTFIFTIDAITVNAAELPARMRNGQFTYLGYNGAGTITSYYIVDIPPQPVVQPPIGQVKTLPFVTITPLNFNSAGLDQYSCELWFHIDEVPDDYSAEIERTEQVLNFLVYAEIGDDRRQMTATVQEMQPRKRNVFHAYLYLPDDFISGQYTYLRFLFSLDEIAINVGGDKLSLRKYIETFNVKFDGYYGENSKYLVAFVRIPERLPE